MTLSSNKIRIKKETNECYKCKSTTCLHLIDQKYNIYICNRCKCRYIKKCHFCQKEIVPSLLSHIYLNDDVGSVCCIQCAEKYVSTCSSCGCQCKSSNVEYCDKCRAFYCKGDCFNHHYCNETIRHHSFKPIPLFHTRNGALIRQNQLKRGLFIGIELEVECGDESDRIANHLVNIFSNNGNNFYLKEDGSLNDGGFEIVTHPMHIERFMSMPWDDILKFLSKSGASSHSPSTCGLHVHFNNSYYRKPCSKRNPSKQFVTNRIKLVNFFNKNWKELSIISKREEFNYCHKNPKIKDIVCLNDRQDTWVEAKRNWSDYINGHLSCGRYQAVNTAGVHTTEIRLWRGTLSPISFKGLILLTHAIIKQCKNDKITKTSTIRDVINKMKKRDRDIVLEMIQSRDRRNKTSIINS
ncbi:amidoligase family protein [bacterium]|nr:amidoligase family protein [bacterium]